MKDRKPFNLDTLMIVYNIVQIIACVMLLRQVGGNKIALLFIWFLNLFFFTFLLSTVFRVGLMPMEKVIV